ncbi:MAG: hypothetical protein EXS03_07925 [Phycisphaerales bacterium]|nr:hypothetical protein [Phycisphaerales bacterium]
MRRLRIVEAVVVAVRVAVLGLSACIVLDGLIRFPEAIRWVMFAGMCWLCAWLWRRWIAPALARHDTTVALALSLERSTPAAQGRLASGIEFASDPSMRTHPLASAVATQATQIVSASAIAGLVTTRTAKREATALALVLAVWVVYSVITPHLATIGLLRIGAPWVVAEWPARTSVRSTTFATHHPRQTSLPLKADLYRGDPATEPVWVRLRNSKDGQTGPWEETPMIHQGETRFERLMDPTADSVEFLFLTRDMATSRQTITFVDAPEVTGVRASITPPPYASSHTPESFDLGKATHGRGRIPVPVLEGSMVELSLATSPHLGIPALGSAELSQWLEQTFAWSGTPTAAGGQPPTLTASVRDGVWIVSWVADLSRSMAIRLVDPHGVHNVDDIKVTIDVVADGAPEATMIEPSSDETVLPSAQIQLRAEGRDDVGLDEFHIEATRGSDWKKELVRVGAGGQPKVEESVELNLALAGASPGDVFEITCVASDRFSAAGVTHEPTRSSPRRIRILNQAQFDEETRNALAAIRQGAIRIDDRERALMERADAPAAQLRPQSEISERIEALRKSVGALEGRAERNHVDDDAMRSLLSAASDILDEAGARSAIARNALQEAADVQASAGDATQDMAMEAARAAQMDVRSELDDLAALLDRDKEAFAATRSLERVGDAITRADDERTRAAARTIGRARQDLTDDEAAALDRAAETTQQAAHTAQDTLEQLRDRAAEVARVDPERAAILKQAADRGEREALSPRIEQAEQATRENRLDDARQASSAAMETVKKMIKDLADDEKSKTQALKRRLAGIAEAIEALVREAESVEGLGLSLLTADGTEVAIAAPGVGTQAARVSRNASGVADEARAAGPQAQRVVRLVERGAEAEGRAAAAFLTSPAKVEPGHEALVRSTGLLREALSAAREQERRTEEIERQERQRELAEKYKTLCDRQEGVVIASIALVDAGSDRRTLVEARRLGVSEEEIRSEIGAIADGSEDVKKSPTFMEASSLAMDAAGLAATDLRGGPPTEGTIEMEREVLETLRGLASALSQASRKKDDPFSDPDSGGRGSQGAGGGGGGQEEPLIPPLAELKVLRSLQQTIYDRTKRVAAGSTPAGALEALATRQDSVARLADALRETVERQMRGRAGQDVPVIIKPDIVPDEPESP